MAAVSILGYYSGVGILSTGLGGLIMSTGITSHITDGLKSLGPDDLLGIDAILLKGFPLLFEYFLGIVYVGQHILLSGALALVLEAVFQRDAESFIFLGDVRVTPLRASASAAP
jgi:hypothetical protein